MGHIVWKLYNWDISVAMAGIHVTQISAGFKNPSNW